MIVRSAPAPGVRGSAALAFERRGDRTVLARSRLEAPMAIVRPFGLPDGGLLIQLLSLGPGLCGGDRLQVDISAGPETRVVVTTTAATRILSMDPERRAEQQVVLRAGAGAALEYYPCLTIPYPDSAMTQTIAVEADETSRLGVVECWALGRSARGEYLRFRALSSRTTLEVGGVLRYADAIHFEPAAAGLAGAGILAGRRYLAAGVWNAVTLDGHDCWDPGDGTLVALAQSTPGVAYLRALAPDTAGIDAVVRRSIERVAAGWRLAGVPLQRFHC